MPEEEYEEEGQVFEPDEVEDMAGRESASLLGLARGHRLGGDEQPQPAPSSWPRLILAVMGGLIALLFASLSSVGPLQVCLSIYSSDHSAVHLRLIKKIRSITNHE